MLHHPPGATPTTLVILEALFEALAQRGVRCCHWKSNAHLAEAMRGDTDLDLLVDRSQASAFREVVADLGFIPVRAAPGKRYAGIENHLGHDAASGRLAHLHVHYDLVLGQQHVKDHRLPIEQHVLASVVTVDGVPIPAPRMELVILALRAVLKYRMRDALKDLLGVRSPGIPRPIRSEAAWLLSRTSLDEVRRTLDELGPTVPGDLVLESIALLTSPRVRGVRLLVLRERMRRALRAVRRLPRWRATARYGAALWRKRRRAVGVGTKRRMTLPDGGTTIAFVGSDGAGKTTVVAAISSWLSWRLDVRVFYMGIPEPTATRWILKRVFRISRAAQRRAASAWGEEMLVTRSLRAASQLTVGLRRVAEARTRVRSHRYAQRDATRGAVVLFDRYPLPTVPVLGRPMDGPRLEQEIPPPRNRISARLVERERELHEVITPPSHLVALNVSTAESLRRKPDHDPADIAAKTNAIRASTAVATNLIVIDADQPLDQVIADVKSRIWSWL